MILPTSSAENHQAMERAEGLVDTAATGTAIRADLAQALSLKATGKRRVYTANGDIMATEYLFRIGLFPDDYEDGRTPAAEMMPFVLDKAVPGFDLSPLFRFPVLIGMDVLCRGDLRLGRDGIATWDLPEAA